VTTASRCRCAFVSMARNVEIVENIDRWLGPDYSYFKFKDRDGNIYILRLDEVRDLWKLVMFQSPPAERFAAVRTKGRLGDGMG
jgi:hypothetical protein